MLLPNDLIKLAKQAGMPAEKRRGITREYAQTLVLYYLQKTRWGPKLIFIGGTALRFIHKLQRFSEDLDFNYQGVLKKDELALMIGAIQKELLKENIEMRYSIRKSRETYFHWKVYMQFPDLLQFYGCAAKKGTPLHPAEQLSIQLDVQNLGDKPYPTEKKLIAHFDKRFLIGTTTPDMFLAEKSNAILFRKAPRGRDFFDFMSLILSGARLDLKCMARRDIEVKTKQEYKAMIGEKVLKNDFKKLTAQLAPFLYLSEDIEIMRRFPETIDDLLGRL
jgi:hypothetical protein